MTHQSGKRRDHQSSKSPYMPEVDQQVTCSAKPGEEDGNRHGIENRKATVRVPASAAMATVTHAVKMSMRQMKVEMQCAAEKRNCGKGKANNETDQIEKFPVHACASLNSCAFKPSGSLSVWGRNTCNKRSAN